MRPSRLVGTFGGIGLLRPAPGTWGSAAAVPLGYLLHGIGGFTLLLLATAAVFAAGIWACRAERAATGRKDASEIVIDEVAGQWVAMWPLSLGLSHAGVDPWLFPWPGWVGAFVMFRLFDIWKPGPVGWADRKDAPHWVMIDDVIAGLMAAVAVALAAGLAHGVLGA
ncbi:phosphatidylglycerophosphatase A family protein [Mangrovicoccus algicola]|uniref:Phosphatidylglycerophosphatase A n=1 Tax=Mangrovicoccus algicola TaxID=2771008 RepID=A0A8J6Z632_9RHOB|nr:phosphatidylglycerophosphatase A [Mangrovicoccus algicola]MBE3638469.1 phosphatidylglycerophosphatase A [Mangrovicoccus algicola]